MIDPSPQDVADLALRKVAAFDSLTTWLGIQIGMEWSSSVDPAWIDMTIRGQLTSLIIDGREARKLRQPWMRRLGW